MLSAGYLAVRCPLPAAICPLCSPLCSSPLSLCQRQLKAQQQSGPASQELTDLKTENGEKMCFPLLCFLSVILKRQ